MTLRYVELLDGLRGPLPPQPWVNSQGVPWTPLQKPLADCAVMMLGSAGVRPKGEPPFQPANDLSFRLIDAAGNHVAGELAREAATYCKDCAL